MARYYFDNGHMYRIVDTAKTWAEAQADAKAAGGHLAIVTSKAENDFITTLAEQQLKGKSIPTAPDGGGAHYLWLGGSDAAREGVWKWTDGTAMDKYSNWGSGGGTTEPDNFQNQDALALGLSPWPADPAYPRIGDTGQWNDLRPGDKLFSVVEWDRNATGGASNDWIYGSSGSDRINGGLGNDMLTGGDGRDDFVFSTKLNSKSNVDTIKDFASGEERIDLENSIFTAFRKTGALAGTAFLSNATGKADDKSDRIIYNNLSGELFYDRDGSGKAAPVLFAKLAGHPSLTASDFHIF